MNFEGRRSRPKSQIMTLDSSSPPPPPQRKNGSLPQQQRWYENDGELKERQLSELKTRMRQMEKTMRWWSDCATNWREKWSQLRLERNQVKEELKSTILHLEKVEKELEYYKGGSCTPTTPNSGKNFESSQNLSIACVKNKRAQTEPIDYMKSDEVVKLEKSITRYLLMLEEANRTIIAEREDKIILHHTVERHQRDLQDLQELYDNLKKEMYELKDYSELDESFAGDREDADGVLSDEELNNGHYGANGAVGYTTPTPIALENGESGSGSINYQSSLLINLSERKPIEIVQPILQIIEDSDVRKPSTEKEINDNGTTTQTSGISPTVECESVLENGDGDTSPAKDHAELDVAKVVDIVNEVIIITEQTVDGLND